MGSSGRIILPVIITQEWKNNLEMVRGISSPRRQRSRFSAIESKISTSRPPGTLIPGRAQLQLNRGPQWAYLDRFQPPTIKSTILPTWTTSTSGIPKIAFFRSINLPPRRKRILFQKVQLKNSNYSILKIQCCPQMCRSGRGISS